MLLMGVLCMIDDVVVVAAVVSSHPMGCGRGSSPDRGLLWE